MSFSKKNIINYKFKKKNLYFVSGLYFFDRGLKTFRLLFAWKAARRKICGRKTAKNVFFLTYIFLRAGPAGKSAAKNI